MLSYPRSVDLNFISVHGCVGDHDLGILNPKGGREGE